ncbi:MAG: hypothetical protein ABJN26_15020 [Stappiaceae bacterium]
MSQNSGILLEQNGQVLANTFEQVNEILVNDGIRAWPFDLSNAPDNIVELLAKNTLTETENLAVKTHFLLSRQRLLEIIAAAGRQPNCPDGGALDTYCIETDIHYPQLHVIDQALDYSGFFPFHVNVGKDESGTDEVGYVLSGSLMKYRFRLKNGNIVVLTLSCPSATQGWLFTFDGGADHGGILDDTVPGTKVLVHAIGPARFNCRRVD